ncbi:MAG: response regulator [Candidatus Sumerlaeia bacterium]
MRFEDIKILIADGSTGSLTQLRQFLRDMSFKNIEVVHDGYQCLIALKKAPFDLLIIDRELPKMDALEVAQYISRIPRFRKPKIVALIDASSRETLELGVELGINAYIVKPFTAAVLKEHLQKILDSTILS